MARKLLVALLVTFGLAGSAVADFSAPYAPGAWSVTDPGPMVPDVDVEGSFSFGGIDDAEILFIESPDCNDGGEEGCPGPDYDMKIETTATADGFITFDWTWDTTDEWPYDRLGVWRNGAFLELIVAADGNNQLGSAGFGVLLGDTFGFGLTSDDSCCNPSSSTVFGFIAGAPGGDDFGFTTFVPLPGALWLMGFATAGLMGAARRR